jgi:hypothetical protein
MLSVFRQLPSLGCVGYGVSPLQAEHVPFGVHPQSTGKLKEVHDTYVGGGRHFHPIITFDQLGRIEFYRVVRRNKLNSNSLSKTLLNFDSSVTVCHTPLSLVRSYSQLSIRSLSTSLLFLIDCDIILSLFLFLAIYDAYTTLSQPETHYRRIMMTFRNWNILLVPISSYFPKYVFVYILVYVDSKMSFFHLTKFPSNRPILKI